MASSNEESIVDEVESTIKKLKKIRAGHKGRVTYFTNKLNNNEYKSIGELESALNRLRLTYSKFDDAQTELVRKKLSIEITLRMNTEFLSQVF